MEDGQITSMMEISMGGQSKGGTGQLIPQQHSLVISLQMIIHLELMMKKRIKRIITVLSHMARGSSTITVFLPRINIAMSLLYLVRLLNLTVRVGKQLFHLSMV
nr:MAG: hypothetical protein AM325_12045 [Candidatus Thorarchaeota archaeon SMTZ1-45]